MRDWGLIGEVPLTPRAARRLAREGALHSFDQAALALNEDWDAHLDGKQVQCWAEALSEVVRGARDAEVQAYEQGQRPAGPPNAPNLLVIGMDGLRSVDHACRSPRDAETSGAKIASPNHACARAPQQLYCVDARVPSARSASSRQSRFAGAAARARARVKPWR